MTLQPSADTIARFVFFLPSFSGGGAERVMVRLANAFAARGHEVDLCVGSARGPCAALVASSVSVVELGSARVAGCLLPLARHLRRVRPDALYATMLHANAIAALARLLARCGGALVLREAVSPRQLAGESWWLRTTLPPLARWLYPRATSVVCVSDGVRDDLFDVLGVTRDAPVRVINNPVDAAAFELPKAPLDEGAPRWLGRLPLVLGIGRLSPHKDFEMLVRAVGLVRRDRPLALAILGEGERREALLALARELDLTEFVLPGFVDDPRTWLQAADVFALSSRNEGFPNALLQALAAGVPAVATRCPSGPDELLEGGRLGSLVPVGNAPAMAEALIAALDAPGEPGPRRAAAARYALDPIVDAYLEAAGRPGAAAAVAGAALRQAC